MELILHRKRRSWALFISVIWWHLMSKPWSTMLPWFPDNSYLPAHHQSSWFFRLRTASYLSLPLPWFWKKSYPALLEILRSGLEQYWLQKLRFSMVAYVFSMYLTTLNNKKWILNILLVLTTQQRYWPLLLYPSERVRLSLLIWLSGESFVIPVLWSPRDYS